MPGLLVVEDDSSVRSTVVTFLELEGFTVDSVGSTREALSRLGNNRYDIVLTDILMPQRDGVEVLREVKRRWPGLPVIAISGGGWIGANELLGMAERLGADNILQKPVRRDDLIRAVDDALAANLKKQA